jgi:hypothetical protein
VVGWTFHAIWAFLFGWAAIDMLVGFAAVAVAVLEPAIIAALIPDLRKWAIATAVVAFTCMGILTHGYSNGLAEKQHEWDAALAQAAIDGEKARAKAVADVPADTTDRGVFSDDPFNRDRGKQQPKPQGPVRWLATHHLFGKQ